MSFLICFVVCACIPVVSLNVFLCFVVCVCIPVVSSDVFFLFFCVLWCVLFCVYLCNELWWTLLWTDLWCVHYMWFWLRFGWLAESGRLCAFDLVKFVYYNFIIIYCYLCYK